jgi:hypothetical protein
LPTTKLAIRLWLEGLKAKRCLKTVTRWRARLSSSGRSANDNVPTEYEGARREILDVLEATCSACRKDCPLNGAVQRRSARMPLVIVGP